MKKLLIVLFALTLTLALAACDRDTPAETEAPAQEATTAQPAETEAPAPATEAPVETDAPAATDAPTTESPAAPAETEEPEAETTAFVLPEVNPYEAAAAGLPTDADSYTLGGENAADPAAQFAYLQTYAHAYEGKTFTLSGNVSEDARGNIIVSVAENCDFVVYFDGVTEPVVGSAVKVTATFTQLVDMGEYVDFGCFTMVATACEVTGEAKGPNGGKLMFVTASSLNVRSSPDSSVGDNKVGLLSNGDMVEVLETGLGANKNWCKITFDCDAGYAYISMSYVSETKP